MYLTAPIDENEINLHYQFSAYENFPLKDKSVPFKSNISFLLYCFKVIPSFTFLAFETNKKNMEELSAIPRAEKAWEGQG